MNRNNRQQQNRRPRKYKIRRLKNTGLRIATTKSSNMMRNETEEAFLSQNRNVYKIPRLMYTPEIILCDLVYPDVSYNRNNVTATFLSWRYRAGSVFDPDPALGSGSVPGYTYYSGGYNVYLVLGLGYDISICNMEASPVDVVVWPSNSDLGLNYAGTGEMFGNPHASQNTVSAKGGQDRCRLRGTLDLGSFYGNVYQYLTFAAPFGANPPLTNIWLNVGGVSATAFTATNGLDVRVTLTYRVAMMQRKTQTN